MKLAFLETTSNCNLTCKHCRGMSGAHLDIDTAKKAIDVLSSFKLLILTGGEPLLHPDIFSILEYAKDRMDRVALATNGTLISKDTAGKLKIASRVSVSLDGAKPETHDKIRGKGTFYRTIDGIKKLKDENVKVQINTTIMSANISQIEDIILLCEDLKVDALHFFLPIKPDVQPKDFLWLLNVSVPFELRLTCAPYFGDICPAARTVIFVCANGNVQPCGYLPVSFGNIFSEPLDVIIGRGKALFKLDGECGKCERCIGCRARAWALKGDYLADDPYCPFYG